jgi:hypothetical protein
MHMQIFKNPSFLGVPIFMGFTPFQHSKLTHPKLWLKYTKLEPPKSHQQAPKPLKAFHHF